MNRKYVRFNDMKSEIVTIIASMTVLVGTGYFLFLGYGIGPVICMYRGCSASLLFFSFGGAFFILIAAVISAFNKWRG